MKNIPIVAIALAVLMLCGCTSCPPLTQQELDRISEQGDLLVTYCGNKDGYAYFLWGPPSVPFPSEKCGKILLTEARILRGWRQDLEFPYTRDRAQRIPAFRIFDLVPSPEEKYLRMHSSR